MKRPILHTVTIAAALLATSALAQVIVDNTKLREWNGGRMTEQQKQESIDRQATAAESRAKYDNVISAEGATRPWKIAQTNPDILPNDVIDDGTRIRYSIVNWWMGDFIGIGEVRPVAGTSTDKVADGLSLDGGIYADGHLYGVTFQAGGGQVLKATFVDYDTETWEKKEITLPAQWYSVFSQGAYNPADGKIYVLGYDGMRVPYLSELDTETGTYTQLVYCPVSIQTMAFDADGKLYALTSNGEIELIDLSTGTGTPLFRVEDEGVTINYWHAIAFDYYTGELFWVRTDNNFATDLRKINLDTKSVEIVSDLPDYGAQGAWVVSPVAPAKAPATVAKLSADFGPEGSHVGTINITAPSTAFDGSELSGDVTVNITVDGNEAGNITLAPGTAGTIADVDFTKSGEHKVVATASNAEGDGPAGSIIAYCGPDTPSPVTDVKMTVADNGTASISWEAPTGGIHNGYFNADLLTYDIVRYPDEVAVAAGIKETTFTETLPATLTRYHYTVTVACDGIEGEPVASNSIVYGDGMTLPFDSALGGEEFFNLCTIYDNDGDGNTWYETWGSASCYTGYHEAGYQSDDWYITPPIALEPGNYFVETVYAAISDKPATVDFTMGNSQDFNSHRILATFSGMVYKDGNQAYKTYVTVAEAGKYYFGYHFTSVTDGSVETPYISIRNLKVEQGPANDAPEAVTTISAKAAELGELKTTVTFTTPSTTFDGLALSSLDRVEVCDENGELLGSVSPVEPGKSYSWNDNHAKEGYNTYKIYAVNSAGRGKIAETEVYAGNDLPDLISSLKWTIENNRVVTFEWGAPSTVGVRGGYVNPDDLTYNFCRSEYDWREPFAVEGGRGLTERKFTWTECLPNSTFGTQQHMYHYGITPVTPLGEGRLGYTGIILGDPCQTPFFESFAGGYSSTAVWSSQLVAGVTGWSMTTGSEEQGITAVDGDNGLLLFSPAGQSFHAVVLPIIELRDMADPVVVFDMYHRAEADETGLLSIQVSSNDAAFVPVGEIPAKADADGWTEHKISIKDFNGGNRISIALAGIGSGAASTFAVDNIRVCDNIDYDIAALSLTAPEAMDLGETGAFTVKVMSKGLETVENFDIDIYADGVKVATASGTQLAPGSTVDLTANVTTNAANAGKTVKYEARVNLDNDGNSLNDIVSTSVSVGGSSLPAPRDLTGSVADAKMQLSWTAPAAAESKAMTESFENFTSFSIIGENDWKFIDRDQLQPYGIQGVEYPNMDKARAFMVWAPGELADFAGKSSWMPYSGDKCLISFASTYLKVDGNFDFSQQNDDWLISPHVVGGTELKFMAGVPAAGNTERFEVMVSYGGRNPEDFTVLGEPVALSEAGWKEFTYTLPADAAYFAIHATSLGYESFALMIDNIEFTAGYDEPELIGYNIYLNNVPVNDEPVADTAATVDYDATTDNTFAVSAVYYEGESEATTFSAQSGIGETPAADGVTVTTGAGAINITGADGLTVNVYNTLGYTIASIKSTGNDVVPVQPGIYIVAVAGKSFKVIVR